ncbi:phosphotransferase [Brachybacterium tyrofermentans]|uniref:phosphotransferase n=1 Tax=Brachybacterium tyrofermentans TaxID=47848 RepID=UPI003FD1F1B8
MRTYTHQVTFGSSRVRKRFIRWQDGEADREWMCLTLLDEQAPGLAPRPLERTVENGAPVIVMERIQGTPLGIVPLTDAQNSELGASLRRLYDVPLWAIRETGLEERRLGPTSLEEHVRRALKQETSLSSCLDPGLVDAAVELSRCFLGNASGPSDVSLPVLGIADLNPANVLWDGSTCRLVDFEDGGRTRPGFELADHLEHIAVRPRQIYDADLLCRAVKLADIEQREFLAYRKLWAMFWLHALLPGNGAFLRNTRGSTESQAHYVLDLLANDSRDE